MSRNTKPFSRKVRLCHTLMPLSRDELFKYFVLLYERYNPPHTTDITPEACRTSSATIYIMKGAAIDNITSISSFVGNHWWIFIKINPISRPMPTPANIIHPKLRAASCHINCPVVTAAEANRKITNEEASLNKLSPSKMVAIRLGTFTNFRIEPALTASGGETIPPSKNPRAKDIPGIK